ncbi:MAG TPA: hypothetical protein VF949_02580 [Reyranella sp.]|jgi:hypothetical protein
MLRDDLDGAADTWAFFRHPGTSDHDDRRMSVRPPLRSRPVQNVETITSLIVVAATLLDADVRGGAFTLEQLVKKMRELLRPGRTIAADDVRAVLPGMGHCLATVGGRWRWKRREPAYPG